MGILAPFYDLSLTKMMDTLMNYIEVTMLVIENSEMCACCNWGGEGRGGG